MIQSAVDTTLIPAPSTVSNSSMSGHTPLKFTQSGPADTMSSTRPVATTPTGSMPTISPASRPTFSAE